MQVGVFWPREKEPVLVTGIDLLPGVLSPMLWALMKKGGRKLRKALSKVSLNFTMSSEEVRLTMSWRKNDKSAVD